ncbi:MAG: carboxypeptidase regulatory-like domain-containing protein [Bacteroidales bacterium]|nr:carboxypeptidase regulatory-like domain-containing protein [Bacteroidales bacterium]
MKHSIQKLLSVAAAIVVAVSAFAQVTTSSLAGKISDETGPVAGAAVLAVNSSNGSQYYAISDANGYYRINGVAPGGPYVVTVELLGYQKVELDGLYVALGETSSKDFKLVDDSVMLESVIITADASDSGMNISRAGAGTTISERTKDILPTTSRSLNDLMKLTPQASSTSNGLAIGGGNYRQSYVTVDGAAFNNAFGIGGNLPSGGAPISLDAIQQMSVNITPFDVRHSGFTGGAINAVTKSGTNQLHVSVYDYFTNDQLEGDRIGDQTRSMNKTLNNIVGASVGAPIIKDKLFIFVNFEYQSDETAGSSRVARANDQDTWGGSTSKNRPTVGEMDGILSYLDQNYGYNPGRYQNYSLSTPDWKIMARVDWNINDNNKLNVRFSHTDNKYSSAPSSSVNPLNPKPYDKDYYGRTTDYAMYTESNRYFQEQNFTSLAAELDSRFSDKITNVARFTWSHQNEPRSFVGSLFPTVDIMRNISEQDIKTGGLSAELLNTSALLASFGPDPFTYGNLRDVQTITATDEVSIDLGRHNVVAGAQYEYDNTKNGYMQGGAGYYVYKSWEDFVGDKTPAAFAITHANRDDLQQVYPSFDYHQVSLYAQDEWNISDYFKLTYGIRFELPILPNIAGNENKDYLDVTRNSKTMAGTSTADMPKTTVNISPRVGFNWDILKNRKLVLRGGTGLYTGRIPFVWLVSVAGNSNCLQAQYIKVGSDVPADLKFHDNIDDILKNIYGGSFKADNLQAPAQATILDKNLRMPMVWKSSLALDATLPGGIKASLEGIYNYNLNDVAVRKLGQIEDDGIQLPGEPSKRTHWKGEGIKSKPDAKGKTNTVTPYYLTNASKTGYYYSVTASLRKDFNFGLSLMAAYTRSGSYVLSDGLGDQISSAYNTMTYNVNGSNVDEIGRSGFVSPNRFIANVGYRIDEGKGATNIGLFYEGYNHCYVSSYDYSTFSYTICEYNSDKKQSNSVTGDGGALNLIYIPTPSELAGMPFKSDENKAEYEKFIQGDKYLSSHRGQYMERGAITAPWNSRFNLKISQDIYINPNGKRPHTITFGVDINNVANLLNPEWGCVQRISSDNILRIEGGQYTFVAPKWSKYNNFASAWQMLLNFRYTF